MGIKQFHLVCTFKIWCWFSSWSECFDNSLGTVVILSLVRIGYLYVTNNFNPETAHCKKCLVVLTTEWLPWLQTSWGDVRFILVLEATCISNLNPNHTLQLTTLKHLWESHCNYTSNIWCFCGDFLTDVQWLLYLQDHALVIWCSLIQAGVTLSQMFSGY